MASGPVVLLPKNGSGPPNKALRLTASLLGVFPLAFRVGPGKSGQKEKHKIYLNTVTLIGFIGSEPDSRQTKDNKTFTVLSLATKTSWKNKQIGEWESRTEWHRGVVFGPLAAFAATLKRGAHVQIQGELRSREYEKPLEGKKKIMVQHRVWEIHVTSILKLDRAGRLDETAPREDQIEDSEVAQ